MKRMACLILALTLLLPLLASAEEEPTARAVFELLQSGDVSSVYALFDQNMQKAMSEDDLRKTFSDLEAAVGQATDWGEEQTVLYPPYRITILPVSYEKADVNLQITWQDHQIAGLFYTIQQKAESIQEELPEGMMEENIQVGELNLPGLLTLPSEAADPLPAAVLVHGSGPNDRDETIGGTKLFRDLAHSLALKGIVSARYDKRTFAGVEISKEDEKTFTVQEETIDDAVAAARLLRADPRIDPERIYLIGHSMGAMLAPRIAEENPGLFTGIVMLSGTPKTLADIVLSQNQAVVDALPPLQKIAVSVQMTMLRQGWKNVLSSTEEEVKGKTIFEAPAYYFWEMAQHDTASILKDLDLPALIINGGSDFQVIDADGIDAWQALDLPENIQLSYYPELNHLLMDPQAPETIRGTVQEYDIPCHVAEEVVDEITAFILK